MKDIELIQTALMLTPPWQVAECQFDVNQERLNIYLDFLRGAISPVLIADKKTALSMILNKNLGDI
jgi:hypothetical protein